MRKTNLSFAQRVHNAYGSQEVENVRASHAFWPRQEPLHQRVGEYLGHLSRYRLGPQLWKKPWL